MAILASSTDLVKHEIKLTIEHTHVRTYTHACAHNYVFVTYETSCLFYNKNKNRTCLILKPVLMGMQEALREDIGNW